MTVLLLRWLGYGLGGANILNAFLSADRGDTITPFILLAIGLFLLYRARTL